MTDKVLDILSIIGLVAMLVAIGSAFRCSTAPIPAEMIAVKTLEADPVLASLPSVQKKKVFAALEQTAQRTVVAEEETARERRRLKVVAAISLLLGGATSTLLILFLALFRRRDGPRF